MIDNDVVIRWHPATNHNLPTLTAINNSSHFFHGMEVSSDRATKWWRTPSLRNLNFLLSACYLGAIANSYASSLISNLMADSRWFEDLHGLADTRLLGLVVAAQPLGCIAAFFPAPWLSEKFGRRAGILCGNICMMSAFVVQIFCKSFGPFLAMRSLAGFGAIFNIISSSALLMELAHPRQRAVTGALFNTFFFVGSIAASWTSYGALRLPNSWSWRLPVAVQLVWTTLQFPLVLVIDESPHWLVAHGREERAKEILAKHYGNGHADDEIVQSEFSRIVSSNERRNNGRKHSWKELSSTPGNRRRLLLSIVIGIATQWVGNGVISFYLAPVLRTVGVTSAFRQQGINGGLQIYNWFIACGAALVAEKVGRRRLFLTSAGLMLVFMTMVTVCSALYSTSQTAASGYAVIVFLFLFLGGYVVGLTPIPILYINEIWPGHLRTKGTSVFWVSQALATCFNQYINPIALERIMWKYYLVYVGVLMGVIVFVFIYVPETKGMSLEEVRAIFDGPTADGVVLRAANTPQSHEQSIDEA